VTTTTTSTTASKNSIETTESGVTSLAEQLRGDGDGYSRDCPHSCPGSLTVTDDDTVYCEECRTTPDGVYLPPPKHGKTIGFSGREGWGKDRQNHLPDGDKYPHSGNVRMAGGFEPVYDEEDERRPDGVTNEYTFDLTTY
jgi:hypothetical protein